MNKFHPPNPHSQFWGIDTQPERLAAVLKYTTEKCRILDLGSGRGAYTQVLNQQGFSATGVDITYYDEWAAQKNKPYVMAHGSQLPFMENAFDLSIAFEVLEHILDLENVLAGIARCTKDKFILSVPNCDLNNSLRQYDLAMAHWTDTTHCNFFTKESLNQILSSNGFRILELLDCYQITPNDYYWETIHIPRKIAKGLKKIISRLKLTEVYWSSILVVAEIRGKKNESQD